MKNTFFPPVLISLISLVAGPTGLALPAPPQEAATIHFGLSPQLDTATARVVLTNITHLLASLPAGTGFSLENGVDGSIVATGTVPALPFSTPAAQIQALAPQVVNLRRWLGANHAEGPKGSALLNPPVYLRSVAEHPGAGRPIVLLVGSVLYANPTEPSFNFSTNRLPARSNLALDELHSPFGCAERAGLLTGVSVHWWYLSPEAMPFENYALSSQRWWRCWLGAQGGSLGEYTHSWSLASQALLQPVTPHKDRGQVEPAGTAPASGMVVVPVRYSPPPPAVLAPVIPAAPAVVKVAPPQTGPVPAPRPTPPAPTLPAIVIPAEVDRTVSSVGVIWKGSSDLDISLRVRAGSSLKDPGELAWNTPGPRSSGVTVNALGKYLHDYRQGGADYEWIELASSISVGALADNLEIWCDHFSGTGPVTFTAVVLEQGKIVARRELTIAGNGDGRAQADRREQSTSWARLPVAEMVRPTAAGVVLGSAAQ